jgi:gliding motility-associated-like protein
VACIDSVTGLVNLNAAGPGNLVIHHDLLGLCGDTDTHTVQINPCAVELVNIFTPNNDGFNDLLVFTNIELYPGNTLTIFDRWGQVVYKQDNYQNNWRGDGVAEGTLYFVLHLPDGIEHSGYLMLKR